MVKQQLVTRKQTSKTNWNSKTSAKKTAVKSKKPVMLKKLKDLLTKKDEKYIKENSLATITIQYGGEKYMVSNRHRFTKTATLVRNRQGQVTGSKAIASG